ncbi:MAG: ribosome maturation factor RimM [Candidatus Limnocylindria bacterium]|nr:ribosome maturation factor RimM [Candidatus Limnocylindria bacterium]
MGPRSTSRSISGDDTIVVALIRGPHGTRGEVRLDPRTDVQGRFAPGAVLDCEGVGPLTIADHRGPSDQPIIRFAGYDTRERASELRGRFLRVPVEEARQAVGPDAVLWRDLIGLAVETPEGKALGTVAELIRAGASDVLVVSGDGGRELLLPMIDTVVRAVDLAGGRIVVVPQEEL